MNNVKVYLDRMSKSIADKQWFVEDTKSCEVFVDYGCADGTLIKYLATQFPEKTFIGYDINSEFFNFENCPSNVCFESDLNRLVEYVHYLEQPTCLILSSVLHEIYHYLDNNEIFLFWEFVNRLNPKYIAIRDMFARDFFNNLKISRFCNIVVSNADQTQVVDFERIWGKINNIKNLTHFLLKYKYVENWEREVHENYLSYNLYDLVIQLPRYQLVSEHIYTLPYLRNQILKDFRIDFGQYATHRQILFKR